MGHLTPSSCGSKSKALTAARLCTTQRRFWRKTSSKASCLSLSSIICLQQPFHRWQAERASDSIHFSANMIRPSTSISQDDIPVWADLPKQQRTTAALCLSSADKSGICESNRAAWVWPKVNVKFPSAWKQLFKESVSEWAINRPESGFTKPPLCSSPSLNQFV